LLLTSSSQGEAAAKVRQQQGNKPDASPLARVALKCARAHAPRHPDPPTDWCTDDVWRGGRGAASSLDNGDSAL